MIIFRWNRVAIVFLIALFLGPIFLSGCSSTSTVTYAPYTIPIRVYRVVGEFDTDGDRSNIGCRLTDAEIRLLVEQLEIYSPQIFDPRAEIDWDNTIYRIIDPSLSSFTREVPESFLFNWLFALQQSNPDFFLDPNRINIYFTGNYTSNTGGERWGGTVDPLAARGTGLEPGLIYMNDGGFSFSTFSSDVTHLLSRFTLEHEMGHYLGRFNYNSTGFNSPSVDRPYGSAILGGTRTYLGADPLVGEHLLSPSAMLMLRGTLVIDDLRVPNLSGVPFPEYTQGTLPAGYTSQAQYGAEKGEVSRKLSSGNRFNNPARN
jgi:hypothetical protein